MILYSLMENVLLDTIWWPAVKHPSKAMAYAYNNSKRLLKVHVFFILQRLQLRHLVLTRRTGATRRQMARRASRRHSNKLKWRSRTRTQLSISMWSRTAHDCGFSVKRLYRRCPLRAVTEGGRLITDRRNFAQAFVENSRDFLLYSCQKIVRLLLWFLRLAIVA